MKKSLILSLIGTIFLLTGSVLPAHAVPVYDSVHLINGIYYTIEPSVSLGHDYNNWDRVGAFVVNGDSYYCNVVDTIGPLPQWMEERDQSVNLRQSLVREITPKEGSYYGYISDGEYYRGDIVIPDSIEYQGVKYPVIGIGYPAGMGCNPYLKSVTLPKTTSILCPCSFIDCPELTQVIIPAEASLLDIGQKAFWNTGLTEIVLPDSLNRIREMNSQISWKFSDSPAIFPEGFSPNFQAGALSRPNLGSNTLKLPKCRFMLGWSSIFDNEVTTVIIPEIDRFAAFEGSIRLATTIVSMSQTPPEICTPGIWNKLMAGWTLTDAIISSAEYNLQMNPPRPTGLMDSYEGVELIVPAGAAEAYRSAPIWCNFQTIREVESFDEFLNPSAAIGSVTADPDRNPSVSVDHGSVTVSADSDTMVQIFSLTGMNIASGKIAAGSSVSFQLEPGLYLVKAGSSVRKIRL